MSLVFDADIDYYFDQGHAGQILGGFDINGKPLKVGNKVKFRFCEGNCRGHIYYDKVKFRYIIVTEPYEYVYDFSGVEDIEIIGSVFDKGEWSNCPECNVKVLVDDGACGNCGTIFLDDDTELPFPDEYVM